MTNFLSKKTSYLEPDVFSNKRDEFDPAIKVPAPFIHATDVVKQETRRRGIPQQSIMQTIFIAVSAIIISLGLLTAPALIQNARDVKAKSDVYEQKQQKQQDGEYTSFQP